MVNYLSNGKDMIIHLIAGLIKKTLNAVPLNEFRIEKIIKRKDDQLFVKWKGYNSFNSWINKKDIECSSTE